MPNTVEVTRSLALADLKELAGASGPCITIYLPLEPAPNTSRVDFMRLKGALRQAEQKIKEEWPDLSQKVVRDLIGSLRQVENGADEWGGEGGSLIMFRSPEVFRAFEVKQELDETVVVGDFFHTFPLIRFLQMADHHFYVLALSQNNMRLIRCTFSSAQQVELPPETPTSLEQWLNTRPPHAAPQHGETRNAEPGSTAGSFTSTTDVDNKDQHIANFFRAVNKGVMQFLHDEKAPLVLCGVEYERSIFKQINQYANLVEQGVHGSPDSLKGGELHARALEVVQDFFAQPTKRAMELWEKLGGSQRVSTSFPEIVTGAFQARIAHLFAAEGAHTTGVFDRSSMEMKVQGRHEDLVNATALQTIAFGGDVFILKPEELPGGGQMNAIFRF